MSDNPFVENPGGQPHPQQVPAAQHQQQPQRSNNTLIYVLVAVAVMMVPMMCICVGLLLPAVQAAREAARRMSCSNNLKLIGIALHQYHTDHGSLPPAYTVDAQGQPLHSWRTLLLPYIEQQALYDQIDLNKPWDDPVNQALANTAVEVYHCPSMPGDPTLTAYVAIVDPSGIMTGSTATRFDEVSDGLNSTVLAAETDSSRAVPWMSPQDIDLPTFMNVNSGQRTSSHVGGAHVLIGDGAVMFITDALSSTQRKELVTKAGGEAGPM